MLPCSIWQQCAYLHCKQWFLIFRLCHKRHCTFVLSLQRPQANASSGDLGSCLFNSDCFLWTLKNVTSAISAQENSKLFQLVFPDSTIAISFEILTCEELLWKVAVNVINSHWCEILVFCVVLKNVIKKRVKFLIFFYSRLSVRTLHGSMVVFICLSSVFLNFHTFHCFPCLTGVGRESRGSKERIRASDERVQRKQWRHLKKVLHTICSQKSLFADFSHRRLLKMITTVYPVPL